MWSSKISSRPTAASSAVNDVSLTVNDGEFVALGRARQAAAKTTTLNLVAGLIPITSGEISIGDRLVNDLDPEDRDIAMVFQNYALYPQKSVYKNLAFPLQMRKLPKEEIDRKVQGRRPRARHDASARAQAARALRRPAAARGARPRPGARSRGVPDGRAALQSRRQAPRADALEIKRFHQDLKATIIYVTHDQLEAVTMADQDGGDEWRLPAAIRFPGAGVRPSGQHVRGELRRQPWR